MPAQNRSQADASSGVHRHELCLHELVDAAAARSPSALAVSDGERELSYGALVQRANRVAWLLAERGVAPEEPVAVCAERSLDAVVGILGVLKAGACYVPVDPTYPRPRIDHIVQDSRARLVLVQQRFAARLPSADYELIALDGDMELPRAAQPPPVAADPGRLAYVMYTSGSTGRPKGVMVEHRSVAQLVRFYLGFHGLCAGDRTTHLMRPGFDASVVEIWPILAAGGSLHIPDEATFMDPRRLLAWLAATRITFCDLPTVLLEAVFDCPPLPGLSLRTLVTGGDKLRRRPPAWLPCPVYDQYGPTENTVVTTQGLVEPEGSAEGPLHIGRPLPGHRVHLLDAAGEPVAEGEVGEMYLGGVGVARGYLHLPEETRRRFVPDRFAVAPGARLYRTGDLGRLRPDGNLEFVGRVDHQVQIRGFRVELAEIEHALAEHPSVREALVAAAPEADGGLVAYLLAHAGRRDAPGSQVLRAFLAERVPHFMLPTHVVWLDAWPTTPHGKIDRAALPAPPARTPRAPAAPEDPLEREIARIWAEELGVAPVGSQDDFFDLGGQSLIAARIFGRMESELRLELPLRLLFEAPTVAELAAAAREGRGGAEPHTGVIPLQPLGARPPLYLLPGIRGHVLAFRELARALGPDQPCFGLQDPALDGAVPPFASIEAMAHYFVARVREAGHARACTLCGYSFGGSVAIEMARILQREGEGPGLLVLLDTPAPGFPRKLPLARRLVAHATNVARRGGAARGAYLRERWANLLRRVTPAGREAARAARSDALTPRMREVFASHLRADARFRLAPYPGSLTLLRALEQPDWPGTLSDDPAMGWGPYTQGTVRVRTIPGGHLDILRPPHLEALARTLAGVLDEAHRARG